MEINPISTAGGDVAVVDPADTGFNGLTSDSFMKLLIAQLQNQDPTEPIGNEELVSQLSAMRSLQSNIEMTETLRAITTNQQLSTAATFIGKVVTGTSGETQVQGLVDRAFLRDGDAFLGMGGVELPLSGVSSVALV